MDNVPCEMCCGPSSCWTETGELPEEKESPERSFCFFYLAKYFVSGTPSLPGPCVGAEWDSSRDPAGRVVTFSTLSGPQNSCTGTSCLSRQIVTNYQDIFLK